MRAENSRMPSTPRVLVWSDLHHQHELLRAFLAEYGPGFDKRIILADYFDSWNDTLALAAATAEYVNELAADPRNVLLLGNHDISYRFPYAPFICAGYTPSKCEVIRRIVTPTTWTKMKLCHLEQGWLCSHAGVSERVFSHPVLGLSVELIEKQVEEAKLAAEGHIMLPALQRAPMRPDDPMDPGITWIRWDHLEVVPIFADGQLIRGQIVGHTEIDEPETTYACFSTNGQRTETGNVRQTLSAFRQQPQFADADTVCFNWNLDTHNQHYGVIEEGILQVRSVDPKLYREHSLYSRQTA